MFHLHSCNILFDMWNIFEHVLRYFIIDNNKKGIRAIAPRGKLPLVRVEVSVKVKVSFRVGWQADNCPGEKLTPG